MQTSPPAGKSGLFAFFELIRLVRQSTGRKFYQTLALVFFSSLTEGVSIVLLIPIIGLFGDAQNALQMQLETSPLGGVLGGQISISLEWLLLAFVGLVCARAVLVYLTEIATADLIQTFTRQRRLALFKSVTAAKWSFLSLQRNADLDHSLTADVDRLQGVVLTLISMLRAMLGTLIYLVLALAISWQVTAMAAGLGVLLLAVLRPLRSRARAYGQNYTEKRRDQYRVVNQFIASMKATKAYGAETRYVSALENSLAQISTLILRYIRMNAATAMIVQIFSVIGLAGFVYYSLTTFNMNAAQIVTLIIVYFRLAPKILAIQSSAQELNANLSALNAVLSLQRLCEAEADAEPETIAAHAPDLTKAIRFDKVSFSYDGRDLFLKDVSLAFPAGKITAIVGPTASGKSTIADLVMGLIKPAHGEIFIDGAPLSDTNRRAWRTRIGYVPQDTALLYDTVRANLLLGVDHASDADIDAVLKMANADGFVRRLPDGLDTIAGDYGQFLSGGERQRLALARALLRKPNLLILDEATSALDWEHEAAVTDCLKSLRGALTIITIAHRPAMVSFADHVLVLDNGAIVAEGRPEDLLRDADGYLKRFFSAAHETVG